MKMPLLRDLLLGQQSNAPPGACGDIVDDCAAFNGLQDLSGNTSSMVCFRVVHLQPKAQKLLFPTGCQLRQDHIAIIPYSLVHKDVSLRSLTISTTADDLEYSGIRLLSLDSFLQIGFETLMKVFVKLPLTKESAYGIPEAKPLNISASRVSTVVTALVNAGAYPGPAAVYHCTDSNTLEFFSCLHALCEDGWVENLLGDRFRLTEAGFDCLRQSRITGSDLPVLLPRGHIALADQTTHEMLCALQANAWDISPYVRQRLPVIKPNEFSDGDKICVFNGKALDVCRSYIEVLLSVGTLCERGCLFVAFC